MKIIKFGNCRYALARHTYYFFGPFEYADITDLSLNRVRIKWWGGHIRNLTNPYELDKFSTKDYEYLCKIIKNYTHGVIPGKDIDYITVLSTNVKFGK